MDCAEFKEIVQDLDRPGTRGLEMRERALAHAEGCSRCGLLVTESEALDFGLHALALQESEQKASPGVEGVLLSEFRRHKMQAAPRIVRWQIAAIGVAAMALFALGITLWRQSSTNLHDSNSAMNSSAKTGTASTTANPAIAIPLVGSVPPSAQGDPAFADAENQTDDSEYATAFVALPYADDMTSFDSGAVVRVMLTRSALASLGLPDAEMGGAERIPADLVVSDDGTPQAIRLVSQANYE